MQCERFFLKIPFYDFLYVTHFVLQSMNASDKLMN